MLVEKPDLERVHWIQMCADSCFDICIPASLLVNDAAKVDEGFHSL